MCKIYFNFLPENRDHFSNIFFFCFHIFVVFVLMIIVLAILFCFFYFNLIFIHQNQATINLELFTNLNFWYKSSRSGTGCKKLLERKLKLKQRQIYFVWMFCYRYSNIFDKKKFNKLKKKKNKQTKHKVSWINI